MKSAYLPFAGKSYTTFHFIDCNRNGFWAV